MDLLETVTALWQALSTYMVYMYKIRLDFLTLIRNVSIYYAYIDVQMLVRSKNKLKLVIGRKHEILNLGPSTTTVRCGLVVH